MTEPHPFDPAVDDPSNAEEAIIADVYHRLQGKRLQAPAEQIREESTRSVQFALAEEQGKRYLGEDDGATSEAVPEGLVDRDQRR